MQLVQLERKVMCSSPKIGGEHCQAIPFLLTMVEEAYEVRQNLLAWEGSWLWMDYGPSTGDTPGTWKANLLALCVFSEFLMLLLILASLPLAVPLT